MTLCWDTDILTDLVSSDLDISHSKIKTRM
jgi:hypothetical protein